MSDRSCLGLIGLSLKLVSGSSGIHVQSLMVSSVIGELVADPTTDKKDRMSNLAVAALTCHVLTSSCSK